MRNPVCVNGIKKHWFTYCRSCIEAWFERHDTNPMTREKLSCKDLVPDEDLQNQIELLFRSADKARHDRRSLVLHGGRCSRVKADHAVRAQAFYEEHLRHLAPEHHWSGWCQEKFDIWLDRLQRVYHSRQENKENDDGVDCRTSTDFLRMVDTLEQVALEDVAGMANKARERIHTATNGHDQAQIIEEIQKEIGSVKRCFKGVVDLLAWMGKKIWRGICWIGKEIFHFCAFVRGLFFPRSSTKASRQ